MNGEAGIIANQLKKVIRDKNGVLDHEDAAVIKKRLGDVLYYLAALGDYLDLTLSEIAEQNLQQSADFLKNHKPSN